VLMKIGSADGGCVRASVLLGQQEGNRFVAVRRLDVAGLWAPTVSTVSEMELDAGDYQVLGYSCATPSGKQFAFSSLVGFAYRGSLARFSVQAGEVVNVGYLHLDAGRVRRNVVSRSVPMTIAAQDWPFDEIERFRRDRPDLFAPMVTRLMVLIDDTPTEDDVRRMCEDVRALQAAGKVQEVPPICGSAARR